VFVNPTYYAYIPLILSVLAINLGLYEINYFSVVHRILVIGFWMKIMLLLINYFQHEF